MNTGLFFTKTHEMFSEDGQRVIDEEIFNEYDEKISPVPDVVQNLLPCLQIKSHYIVENRGYGMRMRQILNV